MAGPSSLLAFCSRKATTMLTFGPVDPDESSTYELVDSDGFDITYLDSRNIQGDYFEDTVHFGDISVEKQQLGLATSSVRPTGIMGLGFSANVASSRKYATIIENMVEQGFIDTLAFSLYLVRTPGKNTLLLFSCVFEEASFTNVGFMMAERPLHRLW